MDITTGSTLTTPGVVTLLVGLVALSTILVRLGRVLQRQDGGEQRQSEAMAHVLESLKAVSDAVRALADKLEARDGATNARLAEWSGWRAGMDGRVEALEDESEKARERHHDSITPAITRIEGKADGLVIRVDAIERERRSGQDRRSG